MREWNASVYHRVSEPQWEWGVRVLDRLALAGGELVLDIGCGTGRLTALVLERVPRGGVVAIDLSGNMLQAAREFLRPRFEMQIQFVLADAAALPFAERADAVFSTASFHWVRDHPRLFRSVYAALKPGGTLVAQCGGGPNVERVRMRCQDIMKEPPFAAFCADWHDPWEFADAETTARRLSEAGFVDVRTNVHPTPASMPNRAAYKEFVAHVVCRQHLERLPDAALRDQFMEALTEKASLDNPPFELDYWRLDLDARKPG